MRLLVRVRALRRVRGSSRASFGDFDIETDGQILRGITRPVITCLIPEASAQNVFTGLHRMQRVDEDVDGEVSGVNIKLFVRGKSEAHVFTVGVGSFADDNVGRGLKLERGGDKEF